MDDGRVFSKENADAGIKAVCEAFDSLGLTLTERWWASKCVATASGEMLGEKFSELAEKWERSLKGVDDAPDPAGDLDDEGVAHAEETHPFRHPFSPSVIKSLKAFRLNWQKQT